MKALDKCVLFSLVITVSLYVLSSLTSTTIISTPKRIISAKNHRDHDQPVYSASESLMRRSLRVNHVCNKYSEMSFYTPKRNKTIPPYKYKAYLTHHGRSLLYCPVPKCGWSSWRAMFFTELYKGEASLTDLLQDPERTGWLTPWEKIGMSSHSILESRNMSAAKLTSKMIFVRDPYDRLVSAYRDKAVRENGIYSKTERTPCSWIKPDSSILTFPQFIGCILDNAKEQSGNRLDSLRAGELLDMHWRPQYLLCNVCAINFNIIGHFDHMNEDMEAALGLLDMKVKPVWGNTGGKRRPLSKYYKQLTELQLRELQLLYKYDFELFGFPTTVPII